MTERRIGQQPTEGICAQRIVFRGHVQGVGFRFTAASFAKHFSVAGYVKNLPDGTVEMVVEGPKDHVASIRSRLAEHFAGHIESQEVSDVSAHEPFAGFEIRR